MSTEAAFDQRLRLAEHVATSDLHGELVLLNFATETYYGLDTVGARIVDVLGASPTIEAGLSTLLGEFAVDESRLRADVARLVGELVESGLAEVAAAG